MNGNLWCNRSVMHQKPAVTQQVFHCHLLIVDGFCLISIFIENPKHIRWGIVLTQQLGHTGIAEISSPLIAGLIPIEPGYSAIFANGANAHYALRTLNHWIRGENQVLINGVVWCYQHSIQIDKGYHTAIAGILAVQVHILLTGAPCLTAIGRICIADIVDGITGIHPQSPIGQSYNLRLTGFPHAIQVCIALTAVPGDTTIIGVNHASKLISSLIVVQRENQPLLSVILEGKSPTGAYPCESLIFIQFNIQKLGVTPHQTVGTNGSTTVHNIKHRIGFPLRIQEKQIALHNLIAVQLGAIVWAYCILSHLIYFCVILYGIGSCGVHIQPWVHPYTGLLVVNCLTDGVEYNILSIDLHGLSSRGMVDVHIVGIAAFGGGRCLTGGSLCHK